MLLTCARGFEMSGDRISYQFNTYVAEISFARPTFYMIVPCFFEVPLSTAWTCLEFYLSTRSSLFHEFINPQSSFCYRSSIKHGSAPVRNVLGILSTTMLKMAIPTDHLPCKATDKISFTIILSFVVFRSAHSGM